MSTHALRGGLLVLVGSRDQIRARRRSGSLEPSKLLFAAAPRDRTGRGRAHDKVATNNHIGSFGSPDVPMEMGMRSARTATLPAAGVGVGMTVVGEHSFEQIKARSALMEAIFNSAYFWQMATDAAGVIQIFNVGADAMLGYDAVDVVDRITPADISDPAELIQRGAELSAELDTPIAPGFEALVFKRKRGIENSYELTSGRKDGSRFPAIVSVTALRDAQEDIIGYLLIGTDNTAGKARSALSDA